MSISAFSVELSRLQECVSCPISLKTVSSLTIGGEGAL